MHQSIIRDIIPDSFIWIFAVIVIVAILVAIFLVKPKKENLSNYIKRPFLFDAKTEFEIFHMLIELFGDRYYVFPQVHYSHLIETRKGLEFSERMKYWNKINTKSADFVLCDKKQVVAQLVIELDGSSHDLKKKIERDEFINELMKVTGLEILHIKTGDLNRDFVKNAVESKLIKPSQV